MYIQFHVKQDYNRTLVHVIPLAGLSYETANRLDFILFLMWCSYSDCNIQSHMNRKLEDLWSRVSILKHLQCLLHTLSFESVSRPIISVHLWSNETYNARARLKHLIQTSKSTLSFQVVSSCVTYTPIEAASRPIRYSLIWSIWPTSFEAVCSAAGL